MALFKRPPTPLSLPQDDPDPGGRERGLNAARADYRYTTLDHVAPVPTNDGVPLDAYPAFGWLALALQLAIRLVENRIQLNLDPDGTAEQESLLDDLKSLARKGERADTDEAHDALGRAKEGTAGFEGGRPTSFEDYANLFRTIPLPYVAEDWTDDSLFVHLRVAGSNPFVLRGVTDPADVFTDAMLGRASPGDRLSLAAAEGRLFEVDFAHLADLERGVYPDASKYCGSPRALFVLPRGRGQRPMRPVAIQVEQPGGAVFTPGDGEAWLVAKAFVGAADAVVQLYDSHISRVHLVAEPLLVSMHRQLSSRHPLHRLLAPSFEGTRFINHAGVDSLKDGSGYDGLYAPTMTGDLSLLIDARQDRRFCDAMFPAWLQASGATHPELEFPYRDDVGLYWSVIRRFVAAYVGVYYPSQEVLRRDAELRAWALEIRADIGGRMPGLGDGAFGQITTVENLIDTLTMTLWLTSARHAAVHFGQENILPFHPAAPGALFRAPLADVPQAEHNPTLDFFAPLETALSQLELNWFFGALRYTRVGEYDDGWFSEPAVVDALAVFQRELEEIEATIEERNRHRSRPYELLLPSRVPRSINV